MNPFKFINFLAQLLIVAQESLPNPCGWNKSGKLRKLNFFFFTCSWPEKATNHLNWSSPTVLEAWSIHLHEKTSESACHCPRLPKLFRQISMKMNLLTSKNLAQTTLPLPKQGFELILNQLLSRSLSSAVHTQAAWFYFQRPPWCSSSSQHQNIFHQVLTKAKTRSSSQTKIITSSKDIAKRN